MANPDVPFGLRAVQNVNGSFPKMREYTAKASVDIYEGAIVVLNSTDQAMMYTAADGVAGNILGVAVHPLASTATDRTLKVYDDPNQIFEVQADTNTITNASLWQGKLFQMTNATTGNTTTLQSIAELKADSGTSLLGTTTTALAPLVCHGPILGAGEVANASYTRYQVTIAPPCHLYGMGSVGISTRFAGSS